MISKRMRILALTLVSCFCLLSLGMGQQQSSISISSSGTISLKRSYICGNYNSTHYYAQNNVTGNYELISADATQTISYALSKLTSGGTWQETVLLKGTFSIGTAITLSQPNVLLDCRQATLTVTTAMGLYVRASAVTILGGHWIGTVAGFDHIRFGGDNVMNCLIDGIDAKNFEIAMQSGSSYITVQNCNFHDYTFSPGGFVTCNGNGHNIFNNCTFLRDAFLSSALYFGPTSGYNLVENCEFGWLAEHAIYFDGGSSVGHNTITKCNFHDFLGNNGAAIHLKCQNNDIYDNDFVNWTASYTISSYAQGSTYTVTDNDIHHNRFTNCMLAIVLGHDVANYNPVSRTLVHDNVFTSCTYTITLMPASGELVNDTKIYYNDFHNCSTPFRTSDGLLSNSQNTVIAYNYFDATTPTPTWQNTMVYQNTFFPPSTTLAIPNSNYTLVIDPTSYYYVAPR